MGYSPWGLKESYATERLGTAQHRDRHIRFTKPTKGFPGGSVVKNLPANAADISDKGLIPGLGRYPGEGHGNPLQYSCLENPHGQRSLEGYSAWGCKQSDTSD